MFKAACTILLCTLAAVNAAKDDEYYRAGMGNPNVDLKMYWADAHNVIQDLDEFSYLYIQYHNCAWTQNRNTNEEQESGSGDETDYWYMGATPSYAANVAFSLYGSLKGEKFKGCNEDTFINSFTTNQGFESFASAIYYAGAISTDYSGVYSSECQGGAGIACDYDVGFASVTYSTDTCNPAYATGITDTLSYMNSDFRSAQCVKIYDYQQSYNSGNRELKKTESKNEAEQDGKTEVDENTDKEDRNLQNNYGYGYNNYGYDSYYGYNNNYDYSGTPLSILYYSHACFIQNYWDPDGGCPDPYGKLEYYQENFNKGVRMSMKVDTYVNYRANMKIGQRYVGIGVFLFMTAVAMLATEQYMAYKAKKRTNKSKTSDSLMKPGSHRKKTVVELVSSTGNKVKKSVRGSSKGRKKKSSKKKPTPNKVTTEDYDAPTLEMTDA